MKRNWIFTAIIAAISTGLISYFFTRSWKVSIASSIIVLILVLLNNPKRRFIKVFWVTLSVILLLNKFSFKVFGEILGVNFDFEGKTIDGNVSIFLIILAITALGLDFFERRSTLRFPLLDTKSNRVGDVSGNNIHINQNISKRKEDDA